jgi:hypothetical protein
MVLMVEIKLEKSISELSNYDVYDDNSYIIPDPLANLLSLSHTNSV